MGKEEELVEKSEEESEITDFKVKFCENGYLLNINHEKLGDDRQYVFNKKEELIAFLDEHNATVWG